MACRTFDQTQLSLSEGCLPSDLTSANVTPVFKILINFTCLVVKLLEKLVYNQLESFLITSDKFSKTQHGFWKHHSCQTQLLETVHHWAQSLDKGRSVHVAYLDFFKAFDSSACCSNWTQLGSEGMFWPGSAAFSLIADKEFCLMDVVQNG